jgi:hypothetical protein
MGTQFVKPRIRKTPYGWSCVGLGKEGNGATPRGAYFDWLNEASLPPYL